MGVLGLSETWVQSFTRELGHRAHVDFSTLLIIREQKNPGEFKYNNTMLWYRRPSIYFVLIYSPD